MNEQSEISIPATLRRRYGPQKRHRFYKVTFTAHVSHSSLADLCEGLVNGSRGHSHNRKLRVEQAR